MKDFDVDGYRVEAGTLVLVGIYAMHRDPSLWDHRWSSTPTDSARQTPRTGIAGNSCRLVADRGPVSAITSPCSKPPSVWRPSSGTRKLNRSTTTFRSPCRSRWSPPPRSGPAPARGTDLRETTLTPCALDALRRGLVIAQDSGNRGAASALAGGLGTT